MTTVLPAADIVVIVLYFIGCFSVGLWTIIKSQGNLKNFFLANRSMIWWPVGMSLFASNIGSNNFVGIAGSGANSGLAVVMFEWSAVFLLMLLGWVFLPVYISSGIYTMPEYLQKRFGGERLRIYLSCIALTTYLFATVSVDLYSGALFIQQTLGWNIYAGVGLLLFITLIFTGLGGLSTVILTDALAVIIMMIGGLVLCIIGFVEVGGYAALEYKYMRAVPNTTLQNPNTTCGYPREDAFHIFRDIWTADYPWLATILRTTIGALWYWCANQVLVQRALAAKNITHARAGTILAGYLKLTPMVIMVLPGMISRALYPDEVACADPDICEAVCGTRAGCSNIAYPKLVVELMPTGLRGLLIAAMIAAVISTLTSVFNSSTTLFTLDIWGKIRPKAGQRELLFVGRIFIVILTMISVIWIPIMSNAEGGEIFRYATSITGHFGAPTCAMFILAMFWNRTSEPGAFWGMLIAQAWGFVRFVLDFVYSAPECGEEDTRPPIVKDLNVYYHTVTQIALAFLAVMTISLFTKAIPESQLGGLTYWKRYEKPVYDYEWEAAQKERKKITMETKAEVHVGMKENLSNEKTNYGTLNGNMDDIALKQPEKLTYMDRFKNAMLGPPDEFNEETPDEMEENYEPHEDRLKFLTQSKFWATLLNTNAIIVMTITVFLYGFFH